jgi:hypothetical protein
MHLLGTSSSLKGRSRSSGRKMSTSVTTPRMPIIASSTTTSEQLCFKHLQVARLLSVNLGNDVRSDQRHIRL